MNLDYLSSDIVIDVDEILETAARNVIAKETGYETSSFFFSYFVFFSRYRKFWASLSVSDTNF